MFASHLSKQASITKILIYLLLLNQTGTRRSKNYKIKATPPPRKLRISGLVKICFFSSFIIKNKKKRSFQTIYNRDSIQCFIINNIDQNKTLSMSITLPFFNLQRSMNRFSAIVFLFFELEDNFVCLFYNANPSYIVIIIIIILEEVI